MEIFKEMRGTEFEEIWEGVKTAKKSCVFTFSPEVSDSKKMDYGNIIQTERILLILQSASGSLTLGKVQDRAVCVAKGCFEEFRGDRIFAIVVTKKKRDELYLVNASKNLYLPLGKSEDVPAGLKLLLYAAKGNFTFFGTAANLSERIPALCLNTVAIEELAAQFFQLSAIFLEQAVVGSIDQIQALRFLATGDLSVVGGDENGQKK